ncbi:hypothetical protein [Beggiatoa leptomitoformis]|nr:hypothetical protein [Beggiatoa leptomitoformis]
MTYSTDFRCKVLKVKQEENLTLAAVAKRFQIAIRQVEQSIGSQRNT